MSFFDKFKKGATPKEERPAADKAAQGQVFVQVAGLASANNPVITGEMASCVADTETYYLKNQERYEERGILKTEDETTLRWFALVDCLKKNQYVCELDWKAEKADFVYCVQNLEICKTLGLNIAAAELGEDEDIPRWCAHLDDLWQPQQICMAAFDIDSDSYILLVLKTADFLEAKKLAAQIGKRVDLAKNM